MTYPLEDSKVFHVATVSLTDNAGVDFIFMYVSNLTYPSNVKARVWNSVNGAYFYEYSIYGKSKADNLTATNKTKPVVFNTTFRAFINETQSQFLIIDQIVSLSFLKLFISFIFLYHLSFSFSSPKLKL